jgi:hypothetical protein
MQKPQRSITTSPFPANMSERALPRCVSFHSLILILPVCRVAKELSVISTSGMIRYIAVLRLLVLAQFDTGLVNLPLPLKTHTAQLLASRIRSTDKAPSVSISHRPFLMHPIRNLFQPSPRFK